MSVTHHWFGLLLLVLAVPLVIGINALIIWLVWRAVTKPVGAAAAPLAAKNGWRWLWLIPAGALLGVLLLVGGLAVWLLARQSRPIPQVGAHPPLVLNFVVQRGATSQNAPLLLAAGQRTFTDILRLPQGNFTVNGTIWPDRGGSYSLELAVRRHPGEGNSLSTHRVVPENVPFWLGALGDDEFRVSLSRATQTLAAPKQSVWNVGVGEAVLLGLVFAGIMGVLLWRQTRQWGLVLVLVGVATALLVWAFWPQGYRQSKPVWLPVSNPKHLAALDLDKGVMHSMRTQASFTDKNVWDWMLGNSADLTIMRWQGQWWLRMRDGRLWQVVDEQWRQAEPVQLQEILAATASQDNATQMEGHRAYTLAGALPATYIFQTAEGGYGLLQVRGMETSLNDSEGRLLVVVRTFK